MGGIAKYQLRNIESESRDYGNKFSLTFTFSPDDSKISTLDHPACRFFKEFSRADSKKTILSKLSELRKEISEGIK